MNLAKVSAREAQFLEVRLAMGSLHPAPKIEPGDAIALDQVLMPESHRSVLDLGRQIVVGNRGMGKSLWTHALVNPQVRERVAKFYAQPNLARTDVIIGFNGSDKTDNVAPTPEAIKRARECGFSADDIWRGVIFRALRRAAGEPESQHLESTLHKLKASPQLFEEFLSTTDDELARDGKTVLVLFDAMDRLADNWEQMRGLTSSLMKRALGLRSFRSLRTKIFIRPDQFSDARIFQFPDGSKLKNEHVDLNWQSTDLFRLLFFEILRHEQSAQSLREIAERVGATSALPSPGSRSTSGAEQVRLVNELAGEFMGADKRRGRVYTWVPLHLGDANNTCSPRTFLAAWQKAAAHGQPPNDKAVDHAGLIEGVRHASEVRLEELKESYPWISNALEQLRGLSVPMERSELLKKWEESKVVQQIVDEAQKHSWLSPFTSDSDANGASALLDVMKSIAVMEERANGKINVPDIFRVHAGIKRKGGVAVRRTI
jgi:hypothetical protein